MKELIEPEEMVAYIYPTFYLLCILFQDGP